MRSVSREWGVRRLRRAPGRRARRTLPLRVRRARLPGALRSRLTPHSRLTLRMTVHHPFAYRLGIFNFTGFGIAVLLAFAIAQVISQRELQRRGYDPEPI